MEGIQTEQGLVTDTLLMAERAACFYEALFAECISSQANVEAFLAHVETRLDRERSAELHGPFSVLELEGALR